MNPNRNPRTNIAGMAHYDPETNVWYVDDATEHFFGMHIGPVALRPVHPYDDCAGRPCIIHNPSDHHMRDWPVVWRSDKRMAERVCPHGVGHPDPDDLYYQVHVRGDKSAAVHGCDGCCAPEESI